MTTAIIKPQWSPLTIALMVMGFVIFWPLGLAVIGYIMWGEKFGGSPEKAQAYWNKGKSWCSSQKGQHHKWNNHHRSHTMNSSGNAAFDDYRAEQLRRLEEERARLDAEIDAFHEYMANLNKAKDREEFDRFMNARRSENRQGYSESKPENGDQNNNGWSNNNG